VDKPWFDPETGALLLDSYVAETPSFLKILEDGIVTSHDVSMQAIRVATLLKELDATLDPAARTLVTHLLTELSVLHALQARHAETQH